MAMVVSVLKVSSVAMCVNVNWMCIVAKLIVDQLVAVFVVVEVGVVMHVGVDGDGVVVVVVVDGVVINVIDGVEVNVFDDVEMDVIDSEVSVVAVVVEEVVVVDD